MNQHHDVPPAPTKRHQLSNPKECMRRKSIQCQACLQPKKLDQPFFRCSGCKIDVYCNSKCQKDAWPFHREKCEQNKLMSTTISPERQNTLAALRGFTAKHRMSICGLSIDALELRKDPSNADRNFVKITVHPRDAVRREHAFYVIDVVVVPYSAISPLEAADMHRNRAQFNVTKIAARGFAGTFFVVLICDDPQVRNIVPCGFPEVMPPDSGYEANWKPLLISILNEGIVM